MLVVTGMHRSGTSAVAMTMASMGVDFGPPAAFYAADEWNPRGYYERRDVIDHNSRLLTGFPRTTGRVAAVASQLAYLAVATPAVARRRAAGMRDELDALAADLDGLAVKDPRFCLTLDAWAPHVERTVVVLRHPSSVVASLHRRQRVPAWLAHRFWDRHAAGLLEMATMPTCWVDFDRLGAGGEDRREELARLVAFLGPGIDVAAAQAAFEERFSSRLRHFEPDGAPLPERTAALWARLRERHAGS